MLGQMQIQPPPTPQYENTTSIAPLPAPINALIPSRIQAQIRIPEETAEDEISYLESQLKKLENEMQLVPCTCISHRPSSYIYCPFEKNGEFRYTAVNVELLQKVTQRTFDHLSFIYSVLIQNPNCWYSRPQIAEVCCHKAGKKQSSFLNALSAECKLVFTNPIAQAALKELTSGTWPHHPAFIIGKKQIGRCQYTFFYYKPDFSPVDYRT